MAFCYFWDGYETEHWENLQIQVLITLVLFLRCKLCVCSWHPSVEFYFIGFSFLVLCSWLVVYETQQIRVLGKSMIWCTWWKGNIEITRFFPELTLMINTRILSMVQLYNRQCGYGFVKFRNITFRLILVQSQIVMSLAEWNTEYILQHLKEKRIRIIYIHWFSYFLCSSGYKKWVKTEQTFYTWNQLSKVLNDYQGRGNLVALLIS